MITFGEAYQLEMAERKAKIASVTVKNYEVIFGYCKPLHNKPLTSLKVADLQAVIKKLSDKGIGHATQKKYGNYIIIFITMPLSIKSYRLLQIYHGS